MYILRSNLRLDFDVARPVPANPGIDFECIPDLSTKKLIDGDAEFAGYNFLLVGL
jgi:hypothetical protein